LAAAIGGDQRIQNSSKQGEFRHSTFPVLNNDNNKKDNNKKDNKRRYIRLTKDVVNKRGKITYSQSL
jgi:hypothetical protein